MKIGAGSTGRCNTCIKCFCRSCELQRLAWPLVERGHTLRVLTTDTAGPSRIGEVDGGSRNIDGIATYYYKNVSNYLAYRHRLFCPMGLFREIRPRLAGCDVVHIHEFRSMLTVAAHKAARDLAIPFVLSPHGGLRRLGKKSAKAAFDRLWGWDVLRDAAAVLAVSPLEESEAHDLGASVGPIRALPNGVRPEEFRRLPPTGVFRKRLGLGDGRMVLFLGRLNWIKGADLLIEAFGKISREVSDATLVVAGPDEGQAGELARMASPEGRIVVMPGFLDDSEKREALLDADLLVIPSRHEVFAVTALEALMCGTPVLLSSASGLPATFDEQKGVARFASEEIRDLVTGLEAALADTDFQRAVDNGRAVVRREFSMSALARQAETVYHDVACGPRQ